MMSQNEILSLDQISRRYGNRYAVKKACFTLGKGETVALLGPNGAGKSSLMEILAGVKEPDEGTISFQGKDRSLNRKEYQLSLGYLPELQPLIPGKTVREQLIYAGRLKGLSAQEASKQAEEKCCILKLEEVFDRRTSHLSKGFRQRTALAQAFLGDPTLLFLDEPFSGLDPAQIKDVKDYLLSTGGERTLLISTHVLEHAAALCRRFLIIGEGTILADGEKDELAECMGEEGASLEDIFLNFMGSVNDNGA